MADEVVRSRFEAETSGYERAVGNAAKSADRLADASDRAGQAGQKMGAAAGRGADEAATKYQRLSKAVTDHRGDMEKVGTSLIGIGVGLTAMSVGAGKAAMDWESAWAGVMKTNDGTSEQTQKLEADLRALTGVLPATHTEIAAVAEAAGQLGVGIDDVAGFSNVMLNLGETTNLSADEAATALARFSNIMGTSFDDADRLGSTIVGLGNNFATTEAEIVGMSMRVAAVGRQMGMSESDVLALSTAMSSVGVEAEAGGTAISNVMKKIDGAVREGGDSLVGWAEAAGVSAEEFAAAWQEDPARAMVTLTEGLAAVSASGGDVNGMLSDLGVKGIRESDTLLRLASASGVLSSALDEGSSAWEQNIALAEEARLRYETTESKIAIAWNQIKDAAIDAGGAILPVVATVAEGAAGIASAFASLPDPVQSSLGLLSGVAGVALLGAGGLLTLAPRVFETVEGFRNLAKASPGAVTGLRNFGRVAGGLTAGAAAATALITGLTALYNSTREATPGVEELANALLELEDTGDMGSIDEMFQFGSVTTQVDGFVDAVGRLDLSNPVRHVQSFGDTVLGIDNPLSQVRDTMTELDRTFATMDAATAAEQVNRLREALEANGDNSLSHWNNLKEMFPEYAASVTEAANATYGAVEDTDLLMLALGSVPGHLQAVDGAAGDAEGGLDGLAESQEDAAAAAEELQEAIDAAVESIEIMGGAGRGVQAAQDDWLATIAGITDAVKENGRTLDENTEKGRNNRAELRGLADQGTSTAATMAEFGMSQEEVQGQLASTYEQLVAAGEGFGLGATEAQAMAREMLDIPPDVNVETWMSDYAAEVAQYTAGQVELIPDSVQIVADMSEGALNKAFETAAAIQLIPGYKKVDVAVDDQGTPGQIQTRINAVTGKTETIFVDDEGTITEVQEQILNIDGKDVPVYVKDDGTVVVTQSKINGIHGKTVSIDATWNGGWVQTEINNIRGKTVRVDVVRRQLGQAGVATGGIAGLGYFPKHAEGRLPGHAMGRLPYTGRGTDRILGVNTEGWPVARVDDGEGIIKESSTRKHLQLLSMVNDDDPRVSAVGRMLGLSGYAGGRVGREWSGSGPSVGIDYDRLAASMSGRSGFQNTQYISTQDPTAAAKVARGEFEHMYEVNGL